MSVTSRSIKHQHHSPHEASHRPPRIVTIAIAIIAAASATTAIVTSNAHRELASTPPGDRFATPHAPAHEHR
ncbi:hypothetical protein Purlil1_2348 [Purpureocillium lilacinum]|uniref:Uncharacterized protein n=1 Tax=Purpureocillium lilacinum TaxID=33203 RepID=A0ABR0C9Z6_PURLI|nr:hypothetical protein Purlil1_2348 [Purpureocillium lilacinum]